MGFDLTIELAPPGSGQKAAHSYTLYAYSFSGRESPVQALEVLYDEGGWMNISEQHPDEFPAALQTVRRTPLDSPDYLPALQEATLYATEVPLRTMKASSRVFEIVRAMAETGNPNSVSDAGVGALAARSAVMGACLNVKINAAGLKDRTVADRLIMEADMLAAEACRLEAEVLAIVEQKIK